MIRNKYVEKIFENIPVLFVESFFDINEKLLIDNDFLFQEMKNFDLEKLDVKNFFEKIKKHYSI